MILYCKYLSDKHGKILAVRNTEVGNINKVFNVLFAEHEKGARCAPKIKQSGTGGTTQNRKHHEFLKAVRATYET